MSIPFFIWLLPSFAWPTERYHRVFDDRPHCLCAVPKMVHVQATLEFHLPIDHLGIFHHPPCLTIRWGQSRFSEGFSHKVRIVQEQ